MPGTRWHQTVTQADPTGHAVKVAGIWMHRDEAIEAGWCGCVYDDCLVTGCHCDCHGDTDDD